MVKIILKKIVKSQKIVLRKIGERRNELKHQETRTEEFKDQLTADEGKKLRDSEGERAPSPRDSETGNSKETSPSFLQ
ncbi:hypothetical protein U0070_009506 [Myodes glareolus]|uniref:Uncharacterized protein n=1 Tax=Myodes glareolus TaxID=447135 RepID=A0AAW0I8W3_MYOGA